MGALITWQSGGGGHLSVGSDKRHGFHWGRWQTQRKKQIPVKTMVGDREMELCARDGEGRKNMNCLWNADLEMVWGMRRMRQGNSCRHLMLYYPGLWKVKHQKKTFISCFWAARGWLRPFVSAAGTLGPAVKDVGSRRGLLGFSGMAWPDQRTLPWKNRLPTLCIPAM